MRPNNFSLLICLLILATLTGFAARKNRHHSGHECNYKLCPFKGQETFDGSACGCPIGSDCWCLDQIHFKYPTWDYDQCEAFLFTKQKP